jgi:hypothetical protein
LVAHTDGRRTAPVLQNGTEIAAALGLQPGRYMSGRECIDL